MLIRETDLRNRKASDNLIDCAFCREDRRVVRRRRLEILLFFSWLLDVSQISNSSAYYRLESPDVTVTLVALMPRLRFFWSATKLSTRSDLELMTVLFCSTFFIVNFYSSHKYGNHFFVKSFDYNIKLYVM